MTPSDKETPKSSTWKYILLAMGIFIIFIILIMNCVYYKQLIDSDVQIEASCGCDNALQLIYWANILMTILCAIILIGLIIMISMPNTYKQLSQYVSTPINQSSSIVNSYIGTDPSNPQNSLIKNNFTGYISSVPSSNVSNYLGSQPPNVSRQTPQQYQYQPQPQPQPQSQPQL